jgi:hypothetical protein
MTTVYYLGIIHTYCLLRLLCSQPQGGDHVKCFGYQNCHNERVYRCRKDVGELFRELLVVAIDPAA